MSIISSKAGLIIEAVAKDNPSLPFVPTLANCFVYKLTAKNAKKSTSLIHGRFGSGYTGKLVVTFNKYDVTTLLINCNRSMPKASGTTTLAYLEEINRRYGFDLYPNEVQDLPLQSNGTVCRLTLQPEAGMYTGSVDLTLVSPTQDLDQLIIIRDLTPELNITDMGATIPGAMLVQGHDYSEVAKSLTGLSGTVSAVQATALSSALKSVDTVPWGIVEKTQYSLVNATVNHSGPIKDIPTALGLAEYVNTTYDAALVITPETEGTGLSATPIVIHYNIYTDVRS